MLSLWGIVPVKVEKLSLPDDGLKKTSQPSCHDTVLTVWNYVT